MKPDIRIPALVLAGALTMTATPVALAIEAASVPAPLALGAAPPRAAAPMRGVDGREFTLAAVKGARGTLVIFTCNHCPWVKAWEKRVTAIGNDARKKGLGVIAINPNDPATYPEDDYAEMQKRARSLGLRFPYVVDATSDVARAFGATRTPEAFLFDAGDRLVYHGTVDDNAREPQKVTRRYLKDAVEALVAGRPVPLAETKALGCGIKYRSAASQ